MPCSDSRAYDRIMDDQQNQELSQKLTETEAMLCALLSYMEKLAPDEIQFRGTVNRATVNGKAPDILTWWYNHKIDDANRLKNAAEGFLRNFSESEQEIIKKLLTSE